MTDENQTQPSAELKTWNQQFADWRKTSGKSIVQISKETQINDSTIGDYLHGRIKDLSKVSKERVYSLYKATGLECFKCEEYQTPRIPVPGTEQESENYEKRKGGRPKGSKNRPKGTQIENVSDLIRVGKEGIDRIVETIASQLSSYETVNYGLLKAQQYRPSAAQRVNAIMETLDVLAEEVDYFRTAPESEKKLLVEKLQDDPQSFGYATQMLNIIYSGKKVDSWMLMVQPPSKTKRITGGK
jgi:hypothetical protein